MNALTNQLDERNARKLCARINSGLEDVTNLVCQLYKGKGWAAIGYTSWTECCREEFGKSASWASRQVKLLGKIGSLDASLSCEDSQPTQAKTFVDDDPIDVRSTEPDDPADDAPAPEDSLFDADAPLDDPPDESQQEASDAAWEAGQEEAEDLGQTVGNRERIADFGDFLMDQADQNLIDARVRWGGIAAMLRKKKQ